MCVKLPPGNLNLGPYLQHPTSIYIYGVTTAPSVRDGLSLDSCVLSSFAFSLIHYFKSGLKRGRQNWTRPAKPNTAKLNTTRVEISLL